MKRRFFLSALAALTLASCGSKEQTETVDNRIPIRVQTIAKSTVQRTLQYSANLEANEQVYYNPAGLSGTYYCLLTTIAGDTLTTCDYQITSTALTDAAAQPVLAPTRIKAGEQIIIRATTEGIDARIYDLTGRELSNSTSTQADLLLTAPREQGTYIVSCRSNGHIYTYKIIVQ